MTELADLAAAPHRRHPLTPALHRVASRHIEAADVVTLSLVPEEGPDVTFRHGQFNMLTAFGVGEAAVSVSSAPGGAGPIEHSIRDVGPVTHALCAMPVGGTVGLRGPFGTEWGIDSEAIRRGADAVIVAGGIGLAPLRGAVRDLAVRQHRGGGRLFVLVGARSPGQIVFADELAEWRDAGVYVDVSVDLAPPGWQGTVGVVTSLLASAPFDPDRTVALVCGPEIMMRFTARALVDRGVDPRCIRISIERNMQCGIGLCGHCQLGPLLICRDGPIVPYDGVAAELLRERQR
jgi:NAD(P)H-flavin reductase